MDQVRNDSARLGPPYLLGICIPQNPLCMRRGAQGKADQGSRLSERSEFERDPALPEHRRLSYWGQTHYCPEMSPNRLN